MTADGILFLHAFPLDARMWAPQRAAFARETKVVAVNLPGFGGTAAAGQVMTMEAAAEKAAVAARRAGLRRAVVCGLSMGGYVALALWRQDPSLVAGLVLANTRADADDEPARERRKALAARLEAEGNGFLAASPPPLLSDGAPPALVARVKATIAAQPAASIAAAARGMAARPDSTADLKRIAVPTLVITSSNDTLIPPAITRQLADSVKGARFQTIEGAGHLSNLEAPEAFNALLRAHLARVR